MHMFKLLNVTKVLTENAVLTNVVTEVYADRHSTVDFYKIQNDHISASLVDNTFIEQQSESVVSVHTFFFWWKYYKK